MSYENNSGSLLKKLSESSEVERIVESSRVLIIKSNNLCAVFVMIRNYNCANAFPLIL